LAGLFAKVVVVRSLLGGGAGWLAVVVALNAVVGLAYYVRVAAALYAPPAAGIAPGVAAGIAPPAAGIAPGVAAGIGTSPGGRPSVPWAVAAALAAATVAAVVVGFAPQLVLDAAALVGAR
jgi:NADH-quinone oxidoreductase subunit N